MEKLAIDGGEPIIKQKIPMVVPYFDEKEIDSVVETIKSTWISSNGKKGKELEEKMCKYLGVNHTILVNNCTSALHLALMILGIKSGNVLVPDYTFTSTGLAPILVNASPKL